MLISGAKVMHGQRYRHRKGGTYRVVSTALMESDKTPTVVYRAEYDGRTWVRPLSEFADGRFVPIPDDAPIGLPSRKD